MENLKIVTVKPAKRCEICHQADCFDPETDECTRCKPWIAADKSLSSVGSGNADPQFLKLIERYREYRGRLERAFALTFFPLFLTVILWGKGAIAFVAFVAWLVALAGFALFRQINKVVLICPKCRRDLETDEGKHCPQCGGPVLRTGYLMPITKCGICSTRIYRSNGRRQYKIRHCTHCGVFLTDEGA